MIVFKCPDETMSREIRPEMECVYHMCSPNLDAGHEVDVRDLRFADGTFDITVDKSKSVLVSCQEELRTHKGTMDAMTTTKGDVWVDNLATIFSIKPRLQGPPERVFSDCNKESDETLRQVLPFIHVSSLLIEGWGTRERVSPSTCHLDSHTSSYGTSGDLL